MMAEDPKDPLFTDRRRFLKQCLMGSCAACLGLYAWRNIAAGSHSSGMRVGFRNDAPETLWKWSREASWYSTAGKGSLTRVHCGLCPHECVLAENDRGMCRTRVVIDGKLHTLAYGNPCALHLDPIEKKPLFHFLPGSQIVSLATAGCNLRCINCQNWQISQSKPEETRNYDLFPEQLVTETMASKVPSIAYTYSEPIIFYEYVRDCAAAAKEKQIRNVLVTAGYIKPRPLRELCKVIDGANVDLKGFSDVFYKKVCGARLRPVLKTLEIMREEGVWLEITNLIVPTLSDDLEMIKEMVNWIVENIGDDVPLHFSRFHSAYKLVGLAPTPVRTLKTARNIAREAGLKYVYLGNVPGKGGEDTLCPNCGIPVIKRRGYQVSIQDSFKGQCECGTIIPGVWA